ncbi:MAG: DegT/DnrJ/EryC1/StrS family aminotransferase [Patescibacteria group bacterium]
MILHNKPTIGQGEIDAVVDVLKSNWVAQGPKVQEFEKNFSKLYKLPIGNSVAVSSGTAALFVGLKVLGVGAGDEVILPTYACSAILNAIFMAGAKPILTDISLIDFNPTVIDIFKKINKKTKAIIITHTFGFPFDTRELTAKTEIPIIEDCATALGSRIGNNPVGTFGSLAIFSFYASKIITTGYGGIIAFEDKSVAKSARDFRDFDGVEKYYPRFNFQMSDMSAAMGIKQLERLKELLNIRKKIADLYNGAIMGKIDQQSILYSECYPNYYRFVLKFSSSTKRNRAKAFLLKKEIKTIIPIENWELLHNYLKMPKTDFKNAELISSTTLSIPIYPSLKNKEVILIIKALKEI